MAFYDAHEQLFEEIFYKELESLRLRIELEEDFTPEKLGSLIDSFYNRRNLMVDGATGRLGIEIEATIAAYEYALKEWQLKLDK